MQIEPPNERAQVDLAATSAAARAAATSTAGIPLGALAELDRLQAACLLGAGLAHEISNPLMSLLHSLGETRRICGALEHAASALDGAHLVAMASHLEDAHVSGQGIGQVVRDFRLYLQSDRQPVAALVDPLPAVERAVRIARPQIRSIARLSVSLAATPLVRASASGITQIALNLLLNAAGAFGRPSTDAPGAGAQRGSNGDSVIEIRLRVEHGQVVLEISDNGPGLEADALEAIFLPGVTSRAAEGGLGLGLPICRALARRMGGDLSVRSVPGWLTSFRLALPAAGS